MGRRQRLAATALVIGVAAAIALARSTSRPAIPFDELSLTLEINATDIDSGILFFADTDESLEHLMVKDPSGNTIFELTSSDPQELGLTEIFWETAEPDIPTALLAYPEGSYAVTGTAFDGTIVQGTAILSHKVPRRPKILYPPEGALLDRNKVEVTWLFDTLVDHYWLELEDDAFDTESVIQLPPGVNSIHLPAALFQPDSSYKIGVAAEGPNGNVIVREVEFETLP